MTFEEHIAELLSLGWQLTSLQQFTKQSTYTPPALWRIVLHRPPSLIFSYGWGNTWPAALDAALLDYHHQVSRASVAKPKELSLDDLDL